jgi:hypothetical protein
VTYNSRQNRKPSHTTRSKSDSFTPKVEIISTPSRTGRQAPGGTAPPKEEKNIKQQNRRPEPRGSDLSRSQREVERKVIAGRLQPLGWNPSPSQLAGTTKVSAIDMQSSSFTSILPRYDPTLNFGIQPAVLPTKPGYDGRRYACPACGGATKKKENLENHIKAKHLGLREHACPVCQYRMGTNYDVLEHIRVTHGVQYLPEKTRDVKRKEDLSGRVGSKRRRVGEFIEHTLSRKRGRIVGSTQTTEGGFDRDDEYIP